MAFRIAKESLSKYYSHAFSHAVSQKNITFVGAAFYPTIQYITEFPIGWYGLVCSSYHYITYRYLMGNMTTHPDIQKYQNKYLMMNHEELFVSDYWTLFSKKIKKADINKNSFEDYNDEVYQLVNKILMTRSLKFRMRMVGGISTMFLAMYANEIGHQSIYITLPVYCGLFAFSDKYIVNASAKYEENKLSNDYDLYVNFWKQIVPGEYTLFNYFKKN